MKNSKRCIVTICLIFTGLLCGIIGNADNYWAEIHQQKISGALNEYFSQREKEFLQSDSIQRTVVAELETERLQCIEAWKEELNLEVVTANIEYSIREVISETGAETELLVYEWVSIDYQCIGSEEIETMGFGTEHLITLTDNSEEYVVENDVYSEIIGYESGTDDELMELQATVEAVDEATVIEYENMVTEVQPFALVNPQAYNVTAAVNYSNLWCGNSNAGTTSGTMTPANYNPQFYYINGKDCCNFVSQCLYAGGLPMKGTWTATLNTSGTVTEGDLSKFGYAWRYTPGFESFWESEGYTVTQITSASEAVIGNPIYWLKADGNKDNHNMLIVGTNAAGHVLINGHNHDTYRYPMSLSSTKFYTINIVHDHDFELLTTTASTHTYRCSICEYGYTEAHRMQILVGARVCADCGYSSQN